MSSIYNLRGLINSHGYSTNLCGKSLLLYDAGRLGTATMVRVRCDTQGAFSFDEYGRYIRTALTDRRA